MIFSLLLLLLSTHWNLFLLLDFTIQVLTQVLHGVKQLSDLLYLMCYQLVTSTMTKTNNSYNFLLL